MHLCNTNKTRSKCFYYTDIILSFKKKILSKQEHDFRYTILISLEYSSWLRAHSNWFSISDHIEGCFDHRIVYDQTSRWVVSSISSSGFLIMDPDDENSEEILMQHSPLQQQLQLIMEHQVSSSLSGKKSEMRIV